MRLRSIAVAAVTFASVTTGVQVATASQDSAPQGPPRFVRVACEYEDSSGCYWDARKFGDGRGHSFYDINVGRCFRVTKYWNREYGKTHDEVFNKCTGKTVHDNTGATVKPIADN